MKYLTLFCFIAFLLAACTPPGANIADYPQDLAGKRALLKTKRKELKKLRKLVTKLEDEVREMDPNSNSNSKTLVTTQEVERKDFKRFTEIQGTVETDDLIHVSSETGGRIIDLPVKEGQYVKQGQLIAKLDLEGVKKQIAEVEKSLELVKEVYDRQKRLWDQEIGSEIQYLEAKNNKERLEKSLETLEYQLGKAKVYAPLSGVVDLLVLKNGEMASPGAPIVQILNTNKVKVVADIPEKYLTAVKKGELVTIRFPALDLEKKDRISMIGRKIDPSNRTFKIEIDMANTKGLLKPNLLATVLINDFSKKDAVTVPLNLVQQEVGGKNYVFITEKAKNGLMARKIYVNTGESYAGEIIINTGLKGGEEIIVEGARGLANNEQVKIHQPIDG